jgi:predicted RNase H-like nuclease (RuvC/YqgF family)
MEDFVTLSCPSCGGKLQITNNVERFACASCGNEHLVLRKGGIISLLPLVAGLRKVQEGVDKTASELAIKRLREEISVLEPEIQELLDEVAEVNELLKILPKDNGVDEDDIDKIIFFLEENIQNLRKKKADKPFLGWLTRATGKLEMIESLAEELKALSLKINDKRGQLASHESIVNK